MFGWIKNRRITKVEMAFVFMIVKFFSLQDFMPKYIIKKKTITPEAKRKNEHDYW